MKRILVIFLFQIFLIFPALSQTQAVLRNLFLDGEYFLNLEEYPDALTAFEQLYNRGYENNANINYRIGMCYLRISGEKEKAIPYLEFAVTNISDKYNEGSFKETSAPPHAYYSLGCAYRINYELDKAIDVYTKYRNALHEKDVENIEYAEQQISSCNNAKEFLQKPVHYTSTNIGSPINDRRANYNAVVSGDESTIVYMTKTAFYDGAYYSNKIDGKWSLPQDLTPLIRLDGNYSALSLSFDGTELYIVHDDNLDSEIMVSKFSDGKWSPARDVGSPVNSRYWESHACVSSDGKTIFFSSNRRYGTGGMDIYKAEWLEEIGEWGVPVNLGPEINTKFNEDAPFITEDGKKLFFSSQGHNTMGGFDIFYSTLQENNEWGPSVNMGYPVNTTDDNLFFAPVQNGAHAYITQISDDGFGAEDIYKLEIFSVDNPFEIEVTGNIDIPDNIKDSGEKILLNVFDNATSEKITTVYPDMETGQYSFTVTSGDYNLVFEGEGIKQKTETINISPEHRDPEFSFNTDVVADIKPIIKEYLYIKTIFFEFDDYSLTESAKGELNYLFRIMQDNPSLAIKIIGYTDAVGTSEYNLLLSNRRSQSAFNYLISKDIHKDRTEITGVGETRPIAINNNPDGSDCPEGRKFNRRVEFDIIRSENELILVEKINIPESLKINK